MNLLMNRNRFTDFENKLMVGYQSRNAGGRDKLEV